MDGLFESNFIFQADSSSSSSSSSSDSLKDSFGSVLFILPLALIFLCVLGTCFISLSNKEDKKNDKNEEKILKLLEEGQNKEEILEIEKSINELIPSNYNDDVSNVSDLGSLNKLLVGIPSNISHSNGNSRSNSSGSSSNSRSSNNSMKNDVTPEINPFVYVSRIEKSHSSSLDSSWFDKSESISDEEDDENDEDDDDDDELFSDSNHSNDSLGY